LTGCVSIGVTHDEQTGVGAVLVVVVVVVVVVVDCLNFSFD
jgi:hypothetical protein